MRKTKIALLVIAVLSVSAVVAGAVGAAAGIALVKQAYNGPTTDESEQGLVVHSVVLDESNTLQVQLPREYDSDSEQRFPVLWVLDGRSKSEPLALTADALAQVGVVEPLIVVGVPSSGGGRTDDFIPPDQEFGRPTGRANQFLEFIEGEAVPAIEAAYLTDSRRLIAGHSLGGLFATYAMIRRPELFDAVLAFSPSFWAGDQAILTELSQFLRTHQASASFFYASLGSGEGWEMSRSFEAAETVFSEHAGDNVVWQMNITEGADHGDNPRLSAARALQAYGAYVKGTRDRQAE